MVDSDIGFKEKSSYYDKSANFKTKKTIMIAVYGLMLFLILMNLK